MNRSVKWRFGKWRDCICEQSIKEPVWNEENSSQQHSHQEGRARTGITKTFGRQIKCFRRHRWAQVVIRDSLVALTLWSIDESSSEEWSVLWQWELDNNVRLCIRDSSGKIKRHLSLGGVSLHQDEEYFKSNTETGTNETAYGKNDNDTESNDVNQRKPAIQRTHPGHYGWFQWLRRFFSPDKHSYGRSSALKGPDDVSWNHDADARAQMRREHARMFAGLTDRSMLSVVALKRLADQNYFVEFQCRTYPQNNATRGWKRHRRKPLNLMEVFCCSKNLHQMEVCLPKSQKKTL